MYELTITIEWIVNKLIFYFFRVSLLECIVILKLIFYAMKYFDFLAIWIVKTTLEMTHRKCQRMGMKEDE